MKKLLQFYFLSMHLGSVLEMMTLMTVIISGNYIVVKLTLTEIWLKLNKKVSPMTSKNSSGAMTSRFPC